MVRHTLVRPDQGSSPQQKEVPVHGALVELTKLFQRLNCSVEEVEETQLVVVARKKRNEFSHQFEWDDEQAVALAIFGFCWIQAVNLHFESLTRVMWAERKLLELLPKSDSKLRRHAADLRLNAGDSEMNQMSLPIQCAYVAVGEVPTAEKVRMVRRDMGLFSREIAKLLDGEQKETEMVAAEL